MNFDNDDFGLDDLSDEEKEKERYIRNHPLFKKAHEISILVEAIIETLPEDETEIYASTLFESSIILAPKLAGALGSGSWLISMQNAALIRYHAEYLLLSNHSLNQIGKIDTNYVALLRTEMEEFKQLFKAWMEEVNKLDHEIFEDDWGLFLRK
jgi:hypothetical protein